MAAKTSLDMTKGSALKALTAFTLPALAGNLLNQAYSITDSIVVGRVLGQTSLAAIGVCMPIILLTSSMVIGVNIGVSILMSQAFGRKDIAAMRHILANSLYLGLIISLITVALGIPLTRPVLKLMGTPEGPMEEAVTYMYITFAATICPLMYFMFNGVFRSFGDSVTSLYCLIVSVVSNIVLDILFVTAFHWGVAGSAYATALAQILSIIFSVITLYKKYPEIRLKKEDIYYDRKLIRQITGFAIPIAVQNGFNNLGNIVVQGCINGFGEAVMAAYTAASRLGTLSLMPVENLGGSLSVYAGQNYGAKKFKRIKLGVNSAWILNVIMSTVLGLVLVIGGRNIAGLFIADASEEVMKTAYQYLLIAAVPGILCGMMCIYQQVLRGIGKPNDSVIGGFMQLGAKVVVALAGAIIFKNLTVVWLAWPISFVVGTIYPYIIYKKQKLTDDAEDVAAEEVTAAEDAAPVEEADSSAKEEA